ncbi:MAG: dual specificity protein phosphatase [Terriglobia bacterium]|jgi:protein-tyrosine phosphatase
MEDREPGIVSDDERLDYNWVTERFAVGGAIWNKANMRRLANDGITHIVDLQTALDDTQTAEGMGIEVLWCPFSDDLQVKKPELFERVVDFSLTAYRQPKSRIYIHCEEGKHRSPMMLLAVLGVLGMKLTEAQALIQQARPQVDFPNAYRQSVVQFLAAYRERTC